MPPTKIAQSIKPFWQTTDGETVRLYHGHVIDVLKQLPSGSIQCCVTSPPYFALRDYKTGKWEGGDPKCDHVERYKEDAHRTSTLGPTAAERARGDLSRKLPAENAAFKSTARHIAEQCKKCGAVRIDQQLGSEATPEEFIQNMVLVFREVRRVLRDDGTLWLNLGDSYSAGGRTGASPAQTVAKGDRREHAVHRVNGGLPGGNLVGIPWRTALALQEDGWVLRSDIPWVKRCLSGGAFVYARTQKGDMPVMIKDLVRLRPETVQLWNGEKWTKCVGFYQSKDHESSLEIELRSGERIGSTLDHRWPTQRGLVETRDLRVGDILDFCNVPEKEEPLRPPRLPDEEIGWFVGWFLAEGHISVSDSESGISFSCHREEEKEFLKCKAIADAFGGTCGFNRRKDTANGATIWINSRILVSLLKTYVSGTTCYNKHLTTAAWQRSNVFLRALLQGWLDGDGNWEEKNCRWAAGFCNNDAWASDIRCICSRIGVSLRLVRKVHEGFGKKYPGWACKIRMETRLQHNIPGGFKLKPSTEITAIRSSRARKFWDIEVADDPHLFSLASGVLTHNSSMPESVKNRPAKSLEYVFLLTKSMNYFYDHVAVKKPHISLEDVLKQTDLDNKGEKYEARLDLARNRLEYFGEGGRNFRNSDLWFQSIEAPHGMVGVGDELVGLDVTTRGYEGAHFACYPPDLILPMILAGTSAHGACAKCGAPWKRVTEEKQITRERPNDYVKRIPSVRKDAAEDVPGNPMYRGGSHNSGLAKMATCSNSVAGTEVKTLGWEPTCECHGRFEKVQQKKTSRVVDTATSQKNQERLDSAMHSKKTGLGAYKNSESHEEESTVVVTKYVSNLPLDQHPVRPCRVLDTFIGSGTTCAVSIDNGLWSWGIDLSEDYLKDNAIPRIEGALLRRPETSALSGKGPKKMVMGTAATIK